MTCDGDRAARSSGRLTRAGERRHLLDGAPAGPETAEAAPAARGLPARPPRRWSRARPARAAPTSTGWRPRCGPRAPRPARRYRAALAQRNALLARVRAARREDSLGRLGSRAGDRAAELIAARAAAVDELAEPFAAAATELGLAAPLALALPAPLRGRRARGDRGRARRAPRRRPGPGLQLPRPAPRRDRGDGRRPRRAPLRLAGRAAHRPARASVRRAHGPARRRGATPPLMLLDDVMSELDAERRAPARRAPRRRRGPVPDHGDRARPAPRRRRPARDRAARRSADRASRRRGGVSAGARRAAEPRRGARRRSARSTAPQTLLAAVQMAWPQVAGRGDRGRGGRRSPSATEWSRSAAAPRSGRRSSTSSRPSSWSASTRPSRRPGPGCGSPPTPLVTIALGRERAARHRGCAPALRTLYP